MNDTRKPKIRKKNQRNLAVLAAVFLSVLSVFFLQVRPVSAQAFTVEKTRLGIDEDGDTRFVFEFNEEPSYRVFLEKDPYKISIDLPLDYFAEAGSKLAPAQGAIKKIEHGRLSPGTYRVNLLTKGAVKLNRVFLLPAEDGYKYRLVLDISSVPESDFKPDIHEGWGKVRFPEQPALAQLEPGVPQPKAGGAVSADQPLDALKGGEEDIFSNVFDSLEAKNASILPTAKPKDLDQNSVTAALTKPVPLTEQTLPVVQATTPEISVLRKPQTSSSTTVQPNVPAVPVTPKPTEQKFKVVAPPKVSPPKRSPPKVAAVAPKPPTKPDRFRSTRNRKLVVVIDAGHGGKDPGAISVSRKQEKNITLAFAKSLASQLKKNPRYKVVLTRSTDKFIELRGRVRIAKEAGADLFISLHADSTQSRRTKGASVYTLSNKASDSESARLAKDQNASDLLGSSKAHSSYLNEILISLTQRETMKMSSIFADTVLKQLSRVTGLVQRSHRYAGFRVLKTTTVPAVLVEMGFLTNSEDEKKLLSRAYRDKFAQVVAKAVEQYFARSDIRRKL